MANNYDFLLVNPKTLYGLYQCNEANDCPDMQIGMAHYRVQHPEITQAEDDAMIEFTVHHKNALARAYPDKKKFMLAYAKGLVKDLEREMEKEKEQAEAAGETE